MHLARTSESSSQPSAFSVCH